MAEQQVSPKDSTKDNKNMMSDEALLAFLLQCKKAGNDYRDKFKPTWDECEQQIRCVLPDFYRLKEDWQSKIFIPVQAKKSEIAQGYLNKMIFGKTVPFDITGVEGMDSDAAQNITTLIATLMQNGGFHFENRFVIQESVDIGTGWIKKTLDQKGNQKFIWRSSYSVVFDPKCGHKLDKARFLVDQYGDKDINEILQAAKAKDSIYSKAAVGKFLEEAVNEAKSLKEKGSTGTGEQKQAFMFVKGIDGTTDTDLEIPAKYATCTMDEYWVKIPLNDGGYKDMVITILNDKFILRKDENVFGYIPFQWCRIKPRKYESYGKGYIENTRGLQELSNSCINLGFDSLKISSMDIIVIDESQVKDPTTIKYKPLAVWKMKDINGVKITRTPTSAISDILRGLTLIDQIDQDASGVTRQAQGSPSLSGSGTGGETLGEYQLKLQAIDQRFLDVGRFIEQDYLLPLVRKVFKDIQNPALFTQEMANNILGMREVDDGIVENGVFKKIGTKKIPKLDLEKLRKVDEMELDFKAIGVTQYADKLETVSKFKEILSAVSENEVLAAMTRIDVLWKKTLQAAEIPDYDEFLKTKEEISNEQQANSMPPAGGQGQGGMPPLPPELAGQGGGQGQPPIQGGM